MEKELKTLKFNDDEICDLLILVRKQQEEVDKKMAKDISYKSYAKRLDLIETKLVNSL